MVAESHERRPGVLAVYCSVASNRVLSKNNAYSQFFTQSNETEVMEWNDSIGGTVLL